MNNCLDIESQPNWFRIDTLIRDIKYNDKCEECNYIKLYMVSVSKVCPTCGIDHITGEMKYYNTIN